jgi:hypothetical protein
MTGSDTEETFGSVDCVRVDEFAVFFAREREGPVDVSDFGGMLGGREQAWEVGAERGWFGMVYVLVSCALSSVEMPTERASYELAMRMVDESEVVGLYGGGHGGIAGRQEQVVEICSVNDRFVMLGVSWSVEVVTW